jgi:hypothetical protein
VVEHLTYKTKNEGLNPTPGIGIESYNKTIFVKKLIITFLYVAKIFPNFANISNLAAASF